MMARPPTTRAQHPDRPCPLCGGPTDRVEGAIIDERVFNEKRYRASRPAVWYQCRECEWCEEVR